MSVAADAPTRAILSQIRRIEPVLREHAPANEHARRLVDPVVDAVREAGLYRLYVPARFGGSQLDPLAACQVVETLAQIDSAAAWNVGISTAATAALTTFFGDDVLSRAFGDGPDTVCAISTGRPLTATPSGDGFAIEGELPFMSGAHQAHWFLGIAIRMQDGEPLLADCGTVPVLHIVCLPRSAVQILDRWHVSAMRGTGSTDVAVAGAQVPAEQLVSFQDVMADVRRNNPIAPWDGIHLESSVSLGIARAALRELLELAANKVALGPDQQTIRHRSRLQHNVGVATALIDSAAAYMNQSMAEALALAANPDAGKAGEASGSQTSAAAATDTGGLPVQNRAALQLAAFQAADASARAVALVCEAAGSSAARLEHGFERHARDIEFLRKHASKSIERPGNVGRMLLGLPADWPPLEF